MIWRYSSSATVACSWDMASILPGGTTMPAVEIGPGTHVLVTGASRGIGAAIARAFAARGCTLGLVARRLGPLEDLAVELPGSGHSAIAGDVADSDSIAGAVEQFGDVDVLVANAGITHYRPFAQLPLDEARQMNDVNWLGTIHTVWATLPRMLERGRGHIVVVSSGGGVRGFPSAARPRGRSARRSSRLWRTTGASSSIPLSCACCAW